MGGLLHTASASSQWWEHHPPLRMPVTWLLQLIATPLPTSDFPRLLPSITASYSASNLQTRCSFLLLQEEVRHGAVLVLTWQWTRYTAGVPRRSADGNKPLGQSQPSCLIPLLGKGKTLGFHNHRGSEAWGWGWGCRRYKQQRQALG